MKFGKLCLVVSTLALLTGTAQAEQPDGWEQSDETVRDTLTAAVFNGDDTFGESAAVAFGEDGEGYSSMALAEDPTETSVAAFQTAEIQALARGLQSDPWRIYQYCADRIRYECYWGSKKGAAMTLLEGSGNSFDTSALMVALLRASGFQEVKFRYGLRRFEDWELEAWLGVISPDSNDGLPFADKTESAIRTQFGIAASVPLTNEKLFQLHKVDYLVKRGFPYVGISSSTGKYLVPHVWVTFKDASGVTRELDPSFKYLDYTAFDIPDVSNFGYTRATFLSGLGGTLTSSNKVITGIGITTTNGLNAQMSSFTGQFQSWLRTNHHGTKINRFINRGDAYPVSGSIVDHYLGTSDYEVSGAVLSTTTWNEIPALWESTITFEFGNAYNETTKKFATKYDSLTLPTNALMGRKLSLASALEDNTYPLKTRLRLDETPLVSYRIPASPFQMKISITHPVGSYSNGVFVDDGTVDQSEVKTYLSNTTAAYAITYGFDPSAQRLRRSQDRLDQYRKDGVEDSDWRVKTETLNMMGLNYLLQCKATRQIIGTRSKVLCSYDHVFGRVGQEDAYYLDVGLVHSSMLSYSGRSDTQLTAFHVSSYFSSALEHGVIEQTQGAAAKALSTVRILQLANEQNLALYLADNSNWTSVRSSLSGTANGWPTATLDRIGSQITGATNVSNGSQVLLPQKGNIGLTASPPTGAWRGYGYALNSKLYSGYFIQGGYAPDVYSGGYLATSGTISSSFAAAYAQSEAAYFHIYPYLNGPSQAPITTPAWTAVDPVDMATGAFLFEKTDLECGGGMPLGLSFHRSYNSNRSTDRSAGIGYGWTHNLEVRANRRSASRAAMGDSTVAQMAATYVAVAVAMDVYANRATAKDWAVTALTAGWGIDQLRDNGVSVSMGATSMEFVKMPNGSFIPPAGITMTLTESSSLLTLSERHGNVHKFDADGRIISTTDQSGRQATYTYKTITVNSTDRTVLDQVRDAYGRKLKFSWDNSGKMTKVTETAGTLTRDVEFQYTGRNLTQVINPEAKTFTYQYLNDRIIGLVDERNRTITLNDYDSQGQVYRQRLHGDANKTFQLFFSGYYNVERNPEGNEKTYQYDSDGRGVSIIDALGNENLISYDGQNRQTILAEPENNKPGNYRGSWLYYDADHNLTSMRVPKRNAADPNPSYTTTREYDSQLRLWKEYDYTGKYVEYGYTAKHQLQTIKDRKGQLIQTNTYNTNGTLASVKDGDNKITTYSNYDSFGNAQTITYPAVTVDGVSVIPTETLKYDARGNLTEFTDRNGNKTTTTFNENRQPRVTTLAAVDGTSPTTERVYDNAGNVSRTKDANGKWTDMDTSPTGKRLSTTLPATPAGIAVLTNQYDTRDWLQWTGDAFNRKTFFGYDVAGRLTTTTDPLWRVAENSFDGNDRVVESKDFRSKSTFTRYDWRGDVDTITNALQDSNSSKLDANGAKDTYTNTRSKVFDFTVDDNGRETGLKTPLLKETTRDWNSRGLLSYVQEPSGDRSEFVYDDMGRVSQTLYKRGANTVSVARSLDKQGNVKKLTEGTMEQSFTYDARHRMRSFTDATGKTLGYRYDGNGNLTELIYPAGRGSVFYTWNAMNQLTSVTDWANRVTQYVYDIGGRLTRIQRSNGTQRRFAYDPVSQLVGISEISATGQPLFYSVNRYDEGGRRDREVLFPSLHAATDPAFSATYDDDNRLSSFNGSSVTYDDDGNLTTGPLGSVTSSTFVYDSRNRLTSAGGLNYGYDPSGSRISVTDGTVETKWTINPNAPLSQALVREKNGVTTWYVYGIGLLYEVSEAGTATTYHYDSRGSTVALTQDDGTTVVDRFEYDPHGSETWRQSTFDTPFRFCAEYGVQTDSNGLVQMRARYYSPQIRRFINADPTGFGGGNNWHAYANGNPVQYNDPEGEFANFIIGAVIGAGMDYGFQVAANYAQGKTGSAAWTQVDTLSIAISAGTGALTGGIGGAIAKQTAKTTLSYAGQVALRAAANGVANGSIGAVGQITKNVLDGDDNTEWSDNWEEAAAFGTITGAAGSLLGDSVESGWNSLQRATAAEAFESANLGQKLTVISNAFDVPFDAGWGSMIGTVVGSHIGSWPNNPLTKFKK